MAGLINGKRELQLPWRGNLNDYDVNTQSSGMDAAIRMRPIVQQFSVIYRQLMEDREEEAKRLNTKIHILPHQFCQCRDLLVEIWNDDAIREVFDRRREFPKYYVENVPYFIESIQKLSRKV